MMNVFSNVFWPSPATNGCDYQTMKITAKDGLSDEVTYILKVNFWSLHTHALSESQGFDVLESEYNEHTIILM